jgi:nucleoside-diphosphate-sugar epimerase
MSSEKYPLQNRGIYRNLPTFDPAIKNLTAIITGANGVSGFGLLRSLLESPERWTKIYAISRRPPPKEMTEKLLRPDQRARVEHVASDFLDDPSQIAEALKAASVTRADYIFFYSYFQPRPKPGTGPREVAEELLRINVSLLSNFLDSLSILDLKPRRFVLQTGAKHYGVHLGRLRIPAIESDPRVSHPEPNFYYPQEDRLFEWCRKTSNDGKENVGWNVIRPAWILGAVNNAQMNALYPFAVYAAVSAHRNVPLAFPSSWSTWQELNLNASARLTGYLTEWAVLEDKCKDQAFNAQDTSSFTWDRFWGELIRWYNVKKGFVGPADDDKCTIETKGRAFGEESPMGYVVLSLFFLTER